MVVSTEKRKKNKQKLSAVMVMHYVSLLWRGTLFLVLFFFWIMSLMGGGQQIMYQFQQHQGILTVLWILFALEMIFRLVPSKIRSPGCQKQFAANYQKTGNTDIIIPDNHGTVLALFVWILLNGGFGALYLLGIVSADFMLLLCSAYSVCDMICILFFCPFQTWFFKNRCCVTCRIYNWDFAMIFTPLFFVPGWYTWSLLGFAIIVLTRWEITFFLHPERFSENTNAYLSCANCTEKLCRHKKQLRSFWLAADQFTKERLKRLI